MALLSLSLWPAFEEVKGSLTDQRVPGATPTPRNDKLNLQSFDGASSLANKNIRSITPPEARLSFPPHTTALISRRLKNTNTVTYMKTLHC